MKDKINTLIERSLCAELTYPDLFESDYKKFEEIKIPDEVELTKEDNYDMLIDTNNAGLRCFGSLGRWYKQDDYNAISEYLQTEVNNGNKIWIRRIITHKQGNKYTVLEHVKVNKLIL